MNMTATQEAPAASQIIRADKVSLRKPVPEDGLLLHTLVAASPPLDPNSVYCNLLQCSHFADTALAAEYEGRLVGFISGYRQPADVTVLFIWQVVIDAALRGQGLAGRMLRKLIAQHIEQSTQYIETTINPDNQASWRLFEKLASDFNTSLTTNTLFESQQHFGGAHPDEVLVRIGPFCSGV